MSERNSQPLMLVRQPSLPRCNLASLLRDEIPNTVRNSSDRDGLSVLLTFLSTNEKVKTILFSYLFQVNDWFSTNDIPDEVKGGYLS